MPNYNIFIKSECNFHKGDYKRSTRSGKALSVLSYRSDDDADAAQKMTHSILLRDYVFFKTKYKDGINGRRVSTNELYVNNVNENKDI